MKIALIGYGKMGQLIEQTAKSRGHEIVSIIDVDNQQDFDSDAFASADVAIEFTTPKAAFGNYLKAWAKGVKVVSGSTGWRDEHAEEVERMCTEEGKTLFWASNFSVGMALFQAVNKYLARLMNAFPEYDVELEETHHVHKLDHPSGTAITLAEQVIEQLDRKSDWEVGKLVGPDGQTKGFVMGKPKDMVRINSIRRDEVPGIHTVSYDSPADKISITHDAHSRKGFALGAVMAAEYTKEHSGLLTMADMFEFLR